MLGTGSIVAEKYRLESPLGKGGMGAVWRATHLALGRAVAVKFVLESGHEPLAVEAVQRFMREARSAAAVRHRNVVDVLDFGQQDGRPYLVMECLEGESLGQRLERSPPPSLAEIVDWLGGALGGLAAIHDAGLVHRDLKPANLFLARDADGVIVKVLDFGIARSTEAQGATITHSMQTLGTPHYMSPEQVRSAKDVDARSDLYAIGVILYQALTGKLPFDGPSATAIIAAIVTEEPLRLASLRPDIPRSVSELVHRAMARDSRQRPPDARTMRQLLMLAAQGHSIDIGGVSSATDPIGATIPMSVVPSSESAMAVSASARPKPRTGRRGFLGFFGVVSTLLAVGLAGTGAWMTIGSSALEPGAATSPALMPSVATSDGRGRAGGGPMATGGARAPAQATVAAPVVPPGRPEGAMPSVPSVAIGGPVSPALALPELALRIRDLPADLRGCARVVAVDDRWAAIAVDACASRRDALTSSLSRGAPIASVVIDDALRASALEPILLQTTTRANVREGASSAHALRRSVPDRSLVVGLVGAFGATRSEVAGSGTWVRAIVADGSEGWLASGLLRPWDACVPLTAAIGGARVIVASARVRTSERDGDGLLLLEPEGESDARGRVRLARIDASCGLGETFELPRGEDPIEELIVTRAADEGETLVVVGTRDPGPRSADGAMRWAAWRLDASAPSWELALRSGQALPDARRDGIAGPVLEGPGGARGFWPLRVRLARGGARTWYAWDGTTLVPDTGEPRDAPAPRE